jgi:hypothetical protein
MRVSIDKTRSTNSFVKKCNLLHQCLCLVPTFDTITTVHSNVDILALLLLLLLLFLLLLSASLQC